MAAVIEREAFAPIAKYQPSVAEYLGVESYRSGSETYVLADGSIMKVIELGWFAATHLSNRDLEGVTERVGKALGRVEGNAAIQIITLPDTYLATELDAYYANGSDDTVPLLKQLEAARARFLQASTTVPIFYVRNGQTQFRTRLWRIIVCVIVRPKEEIVDSTVTVTGLILSLVRTLAAGPKGEERRRLSQTHERFRRAEATMVDSCSLSTARVSDALNGLGIPTAVVTPTRLIQLMRGMMYPDHDQQREQVVRYDRTRPFCEQVPVRSMLIDQPRGAISSSPEIAFKVLTLVAFKRDDLGGGILSQALEVLGGESSLLSCVTEGFISINARAMPTEEVNRVLTEEEDSTRTVFCPPDKIRPILDDAANLRNHLNAGGRVFQTEISLVVYGKGKDLVAATADAEKKANSLATQFSIADMELIVEDYQAAGFFFRALPGGFCPSYEEEQRYHYLTDSAVAAIMPFARGSRGVRGSAQVIYHNRDGELFRVDLLASVPSHIATTGMPGQGKSVGTTITLLHALRVKALVTYLDRGLSFQPAVAMLGDRGAFFDARPESRVGVRINLFEGTQSQASYALNSLLPHMATVVDTDPLSNDSISLIKKAYGLAYERKRVRGISYHVEDDINKVIGDGFVDEAWKQFSIKPVSAQVYEKYNALTEAEFLRAAVLRLAVLKAKRLPLRHGQVNHDIQVYHSMGDLSTEDMHWFSSRECLVRDERQADGGIKIVVALPTTQASDDLRDSGYTFEFDGRWEARAAFADDVAALENIGIEFVVPDGIASQMRAEIQAEYRGNKDYAQATEEQITVLVDRRMAKIKGSDFFARIEGTAILQRLVLFREFYDILEQMGKDGNKEAFRLAERFADYVGSGPKAKYFDGPTTLRYDGKMAVSLETGELADRDPHLFKSIAGAFFQYTIIYSQRKDNRRFPKYLPCDESWQLLELPNAMAWINNIQRTGRKFRLYLNMITQAVSDFVGNPAGEKYIEQCPIRIYFPQQPEAFDKAKVLLSLSDQQIALLKSLESSPGYYSECVIDQKIGNTRIFEVVRIILTPEEYWTATTDGEDAPVRSDLIADLEARGQSRAEATANAVVQLAGKYPRGIKVARQRGYL